MSLGVILVGTATPFNATGSLFSFGSDIGGSAWAQLKERRLPKLYWVVMSVKQPAAPAASADLDGAQLRVGVVHARWNKVVIDALLAGALAKLRENGVKESNIVVQSVPGSFELPLAASKCVSQTTARCC